MRKFCINYLDWGDVPHQWATEAINTHKALHPGHAVCVQAQ